MTLELRDGKDGLVGAVNSSVKSGDMAPKSPVEGQSTAQSRNRKWAGAHKARVRGG